VAAGKQADTEKPPEPTDGGDPEDVNEVRADARAFSIVGMGLVMSRSSALSTSL
jgi:hypothetical protein